MRPRKKRTIQNNNVAGHSHNCTLNGADDMHTNALTPRSADTLFSSLLEAVNFKSQETQHALKQWLSKQVDDGDDDQRQGSPSPLVSDQQPKQLPTPLGHGDNQLDSDIETGYYKIDSVIQSRRESPVPDVLPGFCELSPGLHPRRNHQFGTDGKVVVPEGITQILTDPGGTLRYIGESSYISFLQQIRRLVRQKLGRSEFSDDTGRFHIVDGMGSMSSLTLPPQLPGSDHGKYLMDAFFSSDPLFHFIFDKTFLRLNWIAVSRDPLRAGRKIICLFQLMFAVASLHAEPTSEYPTSINRDRAMALYETGRVMIDEILSDGGFWSVQALTLMSIFNLCVCNRNLHWMFQSMAIRAAQALGLHRKRINQAFPATTRKLRRDLWWVLYTLERHANLAHGRPSAITDEDCDDYPPELPTTSMERYDAYLSLKVDIAIILGRICKEVYSFESIRKQAVLNLASQLASVSRRMSEDKTLSSPLSSMDSVTRRMMLQLRMAFYMANIYLTRPFFLMWAIGLVDEPASEAQSDLFQQEVIRRFATACATAADRTLELIADFLNLKSLPFTCPELT